MAIATLSIDIEARLASLQDGLDKTMRSVETTMGRLSGSVTAVGAALGAIIPRGHGFIVWHGPQAPAGVLSGLFDRD